MPWYSGYRDRRPCSVVRGFSGSERGIEQLQNSLPRRTSAWKLDHPRKEQGMPMKMEVTSSAFQAGQTIPTKYTCEGADISPPLQWSGVPAGTKGLALICDDPDAPAGTWVH